MNRDEGNEDPGYLLENKSKRRKQKTHPWTGISTAIMTHFYRNALVIENAVRQEKTLDNSSSSMNMKFGWPCKTHDWVDNERR